ncbi:MAG: methyl-accepting chemotaxis protein, partial [Gammaproteobacteria bacterium]|nr:methyl-accepting chemotaxis protein [Gammaproteobacteria bacterium]
EFSGLTSKSLVKKAILEKKVLKGLERDDDGSLVAAVVFPLYVRAQPVGVAIYMSDMSKAIESFKQSDGSETHLFSGKGKTEYSTSQRQFKQIQADLESKNTALQFRQHLGERTYSMVQLPIIGANKAQLANLLSVTDYTISHEKQSRFLKAGLITALFAFVACMLFMYWFIVKAFKPLEKCLVIMARISAGSLTDRIEVDSSGEFGQLMQGLSGMQKKLGDMIDDINAAAYQIEVSAGNLDKVTNESSHRVTSQSQITQQLVDNIDQLMKASNEVDKSAGESAVETEITGSEVSKGRAIVKQGVDTIKIISTQVKAAEIVVKDVQSETESIGSVLDVIKSIAEQTNLLALNAAIEAARAGEHGRGFAVVADEVRTLANRTRISTQEIETMIEALQTEASNAVSKMGSSISMVEKGVTISDQTDQSFTLIAEKVHLIHQKNLNISSAASHQLALSEVMHNYVQTINVATDDAVNGNQITVKSSQELISLAAQLKQKVSQFKT